MTLILGAPERERVILSPRNLTEIWVRCPTDLLHSRVPLVLHKLVGGGSAPSYMVQTPPGVKWKQELTMPRGMAILVYSDGTYEKLEGREPQVFVNGADLG